MNRRMFLASLAGGMLVAPLAVEAQRRASRGALVPSGPHEACRQWRPSNLGRLADRRSRCSASAAERDVTQTPTIGLHVAGGDARLITSRQA